MAEENHFKKMMRYILAMIDDGLTKGESFIHINRCGIDVPDSKNATVSPSIIKILNELNMEVQHIPLFLCYRIPVQILSEPYARTIKEKFTLFLEHPHVECIECNHFCPDVCCHPCEVCDQMVCDFCESSHAYMEEKRARPQGDPKRVLK